ncbi:hypothetical protein D3C81_1769570 [compost metagenome]
MSVLPVDNMLQRILKQTPELRLQPAAPAHPEVIRVRFQNVQVGIHGFDRILVLLAQAQTIVPGPIPGKHVHVAAVHRVKAFFDDLKQLFRYIQQLRPACGQNIFRNTVEVKGLAVYLFLRVKRLAQMVHCPEEARM